MKTSKGVKETVPVPREIGDELESLIAGYPGGTYVIIRAPINGLGMVHLNWMHATRRVVSR